MSSTVRRFIGLGTAAALTSGCVGIAHMRADVPALEVQVQLDTRGAVVDVVCPDFYAASDAFAAIASGTLSKDRAPYAWERLVASEREARTTCRGESRYIGFPAIVLVPTAPSPEVAKSRQIFLVIAGSRFLHRVRITGSTALAEQTTLVREVAGLNWRDLERRREYYQSLEWSPSQGIVVERVDTTSEGGVLSLAVRVLA